MMDSLIIIGQAAGNGKPGSGAGGLLSMVPLFVIMGVMFFFMFRTQRKQAKQRQEMLNQIKAGDKVVTAGGIMGEIKKVKEKTFIVEIADKLDIEVTKNGVSNVVNAEQTK